MDLVPLIDTFGEAGVALLGGIMLGFVFGVGAQRSRFCTRSAVIDVARGGDGQSLATWMAGSAVALLGVQILLALQVLDVAETRFFSTAQSLSGALVGGLMFGVGMVLARGCVSRLLVLGASGNLRALFSIAIAAVVAYATYQGVLAPLRDEIGGVFSTAAIGGNDALAHLGLGHVAGVAAGAALVLAAAAMAFRSHTPAWRVAGGATVGLAIIGGWYFTHQLSMQAFDPIQTESLSFARPLATTGAMIADQTAGLGMDQGLLIGTLVGAFLSAILFRDFRIATFSEPGAPSMLRYAAGSAMMGFGGILAVGCTVGAGLTGGSVLSVSSLVGLASMVVGAAVADRLVDGADRTAHLSSGDSHAAPAE